MAGGGGAGARRRRPRRGREGPSGSRKNREGRGREGGAARTRRNIEEGGLRGEIKRFIKQTSIPYYPTCRFDEDRAVRPEIRAAGGGPCRLDKPEKERYAVPYCVARAATASARGSRDNPGRARRGAAPSRWEHGLSSPPLCFRIIASSRGSLLPSRAPGYQRRPRDRGNPPARRGTGNRVGRWKRCRGFAGVFRTGKSAPDEQRVDLSRKRSRLDIYNARTCRAARSGRFPS